LEQRLKAGLSLLTANMLVRGTAQASAAEVATMMDALACSISGFSGRNTMGIHGEFLSSNFTDGFALMAACLRQPSFPEHEVQRERELIMEAIREARDNPSKQAFRLLYETMFGEHPYGRLSLGREETVRRLDRKTLLQGLSATTRQGRMVLSVVGGFDPEEVVALSESLLVSKVRGKRRDKVPRGWPLPKAPRQVTLVLPKEQSHLLIGFPGTTLTAEDRFAVEILVEMLGGHGGRLFENVREVKGLAYSVAALSMEGIEPGCVMLYAGTSPGGEAAVVEAMAQEVARAVAERPPRSELSRVKRHLIGSRAITWQRAAARAASMALEELYGNGHDAAQHYAERIDAVTADQVVAVARRYLDRTKRIAVCVGPRADELTLV
jgi:zinc protease